MTPLVADRYRIEGVLGQGGMGVVHAAIDEASGQEVAIKRLRQISAKAATTLARFDREARAMARIVSPHVVRILDAGADQEGPFLVMERLRGEMLGKCLQREGTLPPLSVVELGAQILAGLAAAHHAGVIHRDLKVDNIHLAEDYSVVKILDFGISRIEDVDEHTLTQGVVGTANYLAPEQIQKGAITHQTDLWSVGVLLYRCLTGRYPFEAATTLALYGRILRDPPEPLHELDAGNAAAFEPLLWRALSKQASARFSSADEMRSALLKLRRAPGARLPSSRPRVAFGRWSAVAAVAALVGVAAGKVLAAPIATPTADSFGLTVIPASAEVLRDGVPIVDRDHISSQPSSSLLHVSAVGFRGRDVAIPDHGGRLIVELVPDLEPATVPDLEPATVVATPIASSEATAPDVAPRAARAPASPLRRVPKSPGPSPAPAASGGKGVVKPIAVPPY
jgi:serine/threonine-protein kinase